MYPDMLMSVLVYAQEAPKFSIQPDAVNVTIKAVAKASVILPNGTQIPVFTINVVSTFVFWTFAVLTILSLGLISKFGPT